MKKLSKLSLLGEMDLLSKAELKQLVGQTGNGCPSSKEACSSSCGTGGRGTCTWYKSQNRCACAEVIVEPIIRGPYTY